MKVKERWELLKSKWLTNDMEDKAKDDKVNHPHHYDLPGGSQAIDVITDMLDDAENEGY